MGRHQNGPLKGMGRHQNGPLKGMGRHQNGPLKGMERHQHGAFVRVMVWAGLLILVACQTLTPSPGEAEPPPPSPTPPAGGSGNADVTYVKAVEDADGTWTFHVTVRHPDTGWEDYADGWDVLTPDGATSEWHLCKGEGTVLKPDPESPFTRLLLHPHENEQPFTRSQSGIAVPPDVTQVRVRAHDLVDGYGGREVVVDLTAPSGPDFEVIRP